MSKKRLIGGYPAIGIRPIIDARERILGVRGSLEGQTMVMAQAAEQLLETNLKCTDDNLVRVVIADQTIRHVTESAACAGKLKKERTGITLSVTPCRCYGSEIMDMGPMTIRGVWGLSTTERPGAVYLVSVLAGYGRKGLFAFGIYGKDVQDADDVEIPGDMQGKLLRSKRTTVIAITMRGKSYLQADAVCTGIPGFAIDPDFFGEYLGMRTGFVDETEVLCRIELRIYNQKEYERVLAQTKEKCPGGFDKNPEHARHTREQKEKNRELAVKCTLAIKDLIDGNKRPVQGYSKEILGHNAPAAGFQRQRQQTNYFLDMGSPEAILNSSFDWNGAREPYILATENDTLNGASMLFLKLLVNRAQMFADVCTC